MKLEGQDQEKPEPRDFYSTSQRGIMIGTRYKDAPSRPAILLYRAFEKVGLEPRYVDVTGAQSDYIVIAVGPK